MRAHSRQEGGVWSSSTSAEPRRAPAQTVVGVMRLFFDGGWARRPPIGGSAPLWCSTLKYTQRGVSPVRRAACCNSMDCYGLWFQA
jgi:hypothetical protein